MLPLPTATLPPATHTNAFLLGREELVLVDPGPADGAEIDRLQAAVEAAAAGGQRVTALWLTHHHRDHLGAVAELSRRLSLPVAAHRATAERLAAGPAPLPIDRLLADGDRVVLAGQPPFPVRVLHTPGHASGHLCFLDEDGRSLLAGDMVSALSTIVVDPPEGDMDDYLSSLGRLIALSPRTLFPAHGPPVKEGVAKLKELLDHRLWREGRILEQWRRGVRTAAELRPLVYDDVPAIAYPLAERQIEAHLVRLSRAGKLG
jgi:glyoxylase-like metal-dependent hydrolase (beta-lactamase superfamily II)